MAEILSAITVTWYRIFSHSDCWLTTPCVPEWATINSGWNVISRMLGAQIRSRSILDRFWDVSWFGHVHPSYPSLIRYTTKSTKWNVTRHSFETISNTNHYLRHTFVLSSSLPAQTPCELVLKPERENGKWISDLPSPPLNYLAPTPLRTIMWIISTSCSHMLNVS